MQVQTSRPVIAITVGEPAGIGPEISLRAAWALRHEIRPVLIGDAAYLAMLAHEIDPAINLMATSAQNLRHRSGSLPMSDVAHLTVIDCPLVAHVVAGQLDARNGRAVLDTLDIAISAVQQHWCAAMVTAPLQKSTINDAGVAFSGHTEYLAQQTQTGQVVMMLAAEASTTLPQPLRVALATTHLPLKDVAAAIQAKSLLTTLHIIQRDLQQKFGIAQPRILVAGLNPHAGENGYLGREEIDVIIPVIEQAQQMGMHIRGPLPADTLFQQKYLQDTDCVLAMYHDQGLPVLKFASFGKGVNITLGLPLIRTSVDHGTALDIARRGLGVADDASMRAALRVAADMVRQSQV
jgi:4-hydroxythreonine-4-phosphate dehydrogenase